MASSGVNFLARCCFWELFVAFYFAFTVCYARTEKLNSEVNSHDSFLRTDNHNSTGLPEDHYSSAQGDYRDDNGASLLFTCDTHISFVNLSSHKKELLIDGLKQATFLDYFWNHSDSFIFWSDYQERKIYQAPYAKSGKKTAVVSHGIGSISGISVDWIGQQLYWLDSKHKTLEVAQFDGSQRSLLLKNLLKPRGLALDPFAGFLFWADYISDQPRIERCSMNGNNKETVILLKADTWPNDVTIDYNNKLIYWIDGRLGCIHRSDYYGSNKEDVYCNKRSTYVFSISLFEDMLFWSDTHTSQLSSLNLTTMASSIVTITYKQLYSVKVFHSSRQKQGSNSCSKDNGHCSHLCLLGDALQTTCYCPYGMVLSSDNRTCIEYKGLNIYSVADEMHIVQVEGKISPGFPTYQVHEAVTDGILRNNYFYWITESNLGKLDLHYGNSSTFLNLGTLTPVALDMDDLSGNIYLLCTVDHNSSVISVCTKDGNFFTTLLWDNIYEPISLAVDVHNRLLYWSHYFAISEGVQCMVESSLMDGTQRNIRMSYMAISSIHCPRSLLVLSHLLCWLNSTQIQCTDTRESLFSQFETIDQNLDVVSFSGQKGYVFFVNKHKELYSMNISSGLQNPKYIASVDKIPKIFGAAGELLIEDNACTENLPNCDGLCLPVAKNVSVCPPISGAEKFLVLSTDYGLKGLPLPNQTIPPEMFLAPFWSSHAVDVDFNILQDKVYWIDSSGSISSARRDGRVKRVILPSSEGAVAFCIDWIADNIYWVTSPASVIKTARSDGRHPTVVMHKGLKQPSAIVVDPVSGHLIWSACCSDDGTAHIEKSSLSGSQRTVLVQGILSISDIAVDSSTSTVYWADPSSHVIEWIKIDGSGREVLMLMYSPYSITLSKSSLYWTERNNTSSTVLYASKHNLSERNVLKEGLPENLGQLHLFDIDSQPGRNPCGYYNGLCEQLCFYEGEGKHSCACAFSMLSDNKKTCMAYNSVLLMAHQGSLESFSLENPSCVNPPLQPINLGETVQNLVSIAVHTASSRIFFSDLYAPPYLFYVNMNGGGIKPVLKGTNPLQIEGLVYNSADEYVYWTESISPSVCRLFIPPNSDHQDIMSQAEVVVELDSVDKPRGIVVDECSSFVLWTNWKEGHPSIEKALINGSSRQVVVKDGLFRPNGLALNKELKKIFWADARTDSYILGMANLDGSSVSIVAEGLKHHPYAVAVHQNMLLWTDWSSGSLFYTNWQTKEGPFMICSGFSQPMGLAVAERASVMYLPFGNGMRKVVINSAIACYHFECCMDFSAVETWRHYYSQYSAENVGAIRENAENYSSEENASGNTSEPNCSALCQSMDPCAVSEYIQSMCHCLYNYNPDECYSSSYARFGFLKDNIMRVTLFIGCVAFGLLCLICAFLICRRVSSGDFQDYKFHQMNATSACGSSSVAKMLCCNWVIDNYVSRRHSAHSKESLTLLSDASTCNQQHTLVSTCVVKGDPERNLAAYTSV